MLAVVILNLSSAALYMYFFAVIDIIHCQQAKDIDVSCEVTFVSVTHVDSVTTITNYNELFSEQSTILYL